MRTFHSPSTLMTPEVTFSQKDSRLSIAGECYPENPLIFFAPLFETLSSHFLEQQPRELRVRIHLKYVNSASTKAFRQIFKLLDRQASEGTAIQVEWTFDSDDDALQDLGNDLADDMQYLDYVECPIESVA